VTSMLKRNITALVLISVALLFILLLRTVAVELTDILFFIFMALGAYEMYSIGKKNGYNPITLSIIICLILIYPLFFLFEAAGLLSAIIISVMTSLIVFVLSKDRFALKDLLYTVFVLFYPILLCSSFFLINRSAGNLLGLFLVFFITLLADAFALFAGKLFGKKKLMPEVSPNKTVAGVFGAYFGGILGSTVVFLMFDAFHIFDGWNNVGITAMSDNLYISIPIYLILAVLGSTLAVLGDLAASWLKRKLNVKDFGRIFPGHGGVMDRLDSLLFVAPFIMCFFIMYNGVCSV